MGCTIQTIDGKKYALCDKESKYGEMPSEDGWEVAVRASDKPEHHEPGMAIGGDLSNGSLYVGYVDTSPVTGEKRFYGVRVGIYNESNLGEMTGVEVGLINSSHTSLSGLQVGLINYHKNDLNGLQVSIRNAVRGVLKGVQVALIDNSAWDARGLQAAFVYNECRDRLTGLEVGYMNTSGPIGLFGVGYNSRCMEPSKPGDGGEDYYDMSFP